MQLDIDAGPTTGDCLAEDQKAWKTRRVMARTKSKANNATCMNVTTLYEGGLGDLPREFWKTYFKTTYSEVFGITKGG